MLQVNLYTGALFIQQSLGWDLYVSIVLQIGIVAILTVTGICAAIMIKIFSSLVKIMLLQNDSLLSFLRFIFTSPCRIL